MTFGSICSLAGLAFASLSAALEIGTGIYAQFINGFPFMDKTLLRIYAFGSPVVITRPRLRTVRSLH